MKRFLILLTYLLAAASTTLHAEGGCPAGMVPEGGQGVSSCRPIPGGGQAQSGAPSIAWVSRWGAIAMDTQVSRISGASHDKASRKEAEQTAMKNCLDQGAKQCEIISAYANGCVALAEGETRMGVAARNNVSDASSAAMTQCQDATCRVIYIRCSQPQTVH